MSISYKKTTEKEKDGQIITRTRGYESGRGYYSTSSTRNVNSGKTPPITGPAAVVALTISAVGAGIKLLKGISKSKSANKVKDLEDSVRNSANSLLDDENNYNK